MLVLNQPTNTTGYGQEHTMAKLYFRYGAMNCGKSTSLIQVDYNYRERGMRTLIIKPGTDSKGSDRVISRLEVERLADIMATDEDDLYRMVREWCSEKERIDCVLVDEAQFLKSEQVDQLFKIAVIADIPVICYGLRTDFLLNGFEGSARLLLLAHSIEELKTICRCGQKAMANGRMVNGRFVFEGAQVAIDGEDNVEYESLCPACYFKHRREMELENGKERESNLKLDEAADEWETKKMRE